MKIKIEKAASAYEPELFKTAFGFKGNKLTGVWQTVVMLSDGKEVGMGLGVQSVLWSDRSVFVKFGEEKSNSLMFSITEHALNMIVEREFSSAKEITDYVFDSCFAYAKQITGMNVTETFVLNALVPLDMAAWHLFARLSHADSFDFIYKGVGRCEKLANIPLITYGTPVDDVLRMAEDGICIFKIKLGSDPDGDGDLQKMLEWDKGRALEIHNAVKDMATDYTESGRIVYYFDANGRYDTKERLCELVRFLEEHGIAERTVLFEEPFAEENEIFIGDIPICFAADESAHSLADVKRRIELGYKAITLKPIAKTPSVTIEMANAAYSAGVECFCADLSILLPAGNIFCPHKGAQSHCADQQYQQSSQQALFLLRFRYEFAHTLPPSVNLLRVHMHTDGIQLIGVSRVIRGLRPAYSEGIGHGACVIGSQIHGHRLAVRKTFPVQFQRQWEVVCQAFDGEGATYSHLTAVGDDQRIAIGHTGNILQRQLAAQIAFLVNIKLGDPGCITATGGSGEAGIHTGEHGGGDQHQNQQHRHQQEQE